MLRNAKRFPSAVQMMLSTQPPGGSAIGVSFAVATAYGVYLVLQGQLNLDDLITRTYSLDQINEGYDAMRNGENVRGIILFD